MSENEANYILSDTEIKVLLSGLGYENVMGIFHNKKEDDMQYAVIINVILRLINQNIIRFEEGKMYVDDSLSEMLCCIGDCDCAFSVTFPMSSETVSCYCAGDCAVICEPMTYQNDRYVLKKQPQAVFLKEITEHDDLEGLSETDSNISETNVWKENLKTVALIEIFRKFEWYADISICSHAFGTSEMIVRYADSQEKSVVYTKEGFLCLIQSIISSELS